MTEGDGGQGANSKRTGSGLTFRVWGGRRRRPRWADTEGPWGPEGVGRGFSCWLACVFPQLLEEESQAIVLFVSKRRMSPQCDVVAPNQATLFCLRSPN